MKPHRFHRAADAEYAEAAKYYAAISPQLGGRFHEEIERMIMEIRAQPGRFRALTLRPEDILAPSSPMRSFTWNGGGHLDYRGYAF